VKTRTAQPLRPSETELKILHVLWASQACTVRHVHEVLHAKDGTGYTTALKLLQVMRGKGLVERDDTQRAHVYRAAISKEHTQKKFLLDLVQRVFDGSPSKLVLHALGSQRTTQEELREIRTLLNKLDNDAS
jgi:BlaI family penicillinase repressor